LHTIKIKKLQLRKILKEELAKILKEGEVVDLYPDPFPEIPDSEMDRKTKERIASMMIAYSLDAEVNDLEWNILNILNNRAEILTKNELYIWLKDIHSFKHPKAFDIAIHNLLMRSEIFYSKKTKECFGKQFRDSFPSEKILPLSYYRK
jgi:hypothetical protein